MIREHGPVTIAREQEAQYNSRLCLPLTGGIGKVVLELAVWCVCSDFRTPTAEYFRPPSGAQLDLLPFLDDA